MYSAAETLQSFDTGIAAPDIPARIAKPFEIGAKAVPWAVEMHPYEGDVAAPTGMNQTCFKDNLVLPTGISATMSHAGVKADIGNPDQPYGSWQSAVANAHFAAITSKCADAGWKRVGRAWMQITYKGHWRTYDEGWKHPIYSRIIAGSGGETWSPSGHEDDWYYWDPGDRVRAKFDTVVKSPTGKSKVTKTKTVPVQVKR